MVSKTAGRGFESLCPCHNKINDIADGYGKKRPLRVVFATKIQSSETRRNPPLSVSARFGLWRVCGEDYVQ